MMTNNNMIQDLTIEYDALEKKKINMLQQFEKCREAEIMKAQVGAQTFLSRNQHLDDVGKETGLNAIKTAVENKIQSLEIEYTNVINGIIQKQQLLKSEYESIVTQLHKETQLQEFRQIQKLQELQELEELEELQQLENLKASKMAINVRHKTDDNIEKGEESCSNMDMFDNCSNINFICNCKEESKNGESGHEIIDECILSQLNGLCDKYLWSLKKKKHLKMVSKDKKQAIFNSVEEIQTKVEEMNKLLSMSNDWRETRETKTSGMITKEDMEKEILDEIERRRKSILNDCGKTGKDIPYSLKVQVRREIMEKYFGSKIGSGGKKTRKGKFSKGNGIKRMPNVKYSRDYSSRNYNHRCQASNGKNV